MIPSGSATFLLAAADPLVDAQQKTLTFVQSAIDYLERHSPEYAMCLAVLVVGYFMTRWVGLAVTHALERQALEPPVRQLMVRVTRLLVFGLFVVIALGAAGFNVLTLVAGIGVVGVGVGFAMQGLLSNIVAGLAIIFTKPFRVGEYIEILGVQGQVLQIELVSTTLEHTDASLVVIPNHKIMGEILHNYKTTRQISLAVGVGYTTDLANAQAVIAGLLAANPRVLKNPAPTVTIETLGDSAITISIKPWVKLADVGPAQLELNAAIVNEFRANAIDIPFPQREIRVINK
jgi:small conductance mechanosensitive channel